MNLETRNAVIERVSLGLEHGFCSGWLHLTYGGTVQSFGGWATPLCGRWIERCLQIAGVSQWQELPGRAIRVRAHHTAIIAIGHIVEDRWFEPRVELGGASRLVLDR